MSLDYSTLSDQELEAIANDDYASLSDATLNLLASEGKPPEKSIGEKATQAAGGVAGMAVDAATAGYNAIPYKEFVMPYAGYKAIPHIVEGAKSGARAINTLMSPSAPIAPGPNPAMSPSYSAPSQAASNVAKPGLLQQGSQFAKQMQQIAAEKVMEAAGKLRPIAPAAIGAGAMLYSPGLNQGEDEELKRRRQMAPTIR